MISIQQETRSSLADEKLFKQTERGKLFRNQLRPEALRSFVQTTRFRCSQLPVGELAKPFAL